MADLPPANQGDHRQRQQFLTRPARAHHPHVRLPQHKAAIGGRTSLTKNQPALAHLRTTADPLTRLNNQRILGREDVGSASGPASLALIWWGRRVGGLGPGLTSESAVARQMERWQASAWTTAVVTAESLDRFFRTGNSSILASFTKLASRLGVTEIDRIGARIELPARLVSDADEAAASGAISFRRYCPGQVRGRICASQPSADALELLQWRPRPAPPPVPQTRYQYPRPDRPLGPVSWIMDGIA